MIDENGRIEASGESAYDENREIQAPGDLGFVPFALEPVELGHLAAAPLQLAVVAVRFRPVLSIEDTKVIAQFQKRLEDTYDLLGKQSAPVLRLYVGSREVDPDEVPVETLWRFQHREQKWVVSLTATSLAFEATEYQEFAPFAAEFEKVLAALVAVFAPRTQTRLGVRYINEIRDPRARGERLHDLLCDELVAPVGGALGSDLHSSLSELRFQQPDGVCVIRHGLVQPQNYLLDFDYFVEQEVPFDVERVPRLMAGYHAIIEALFVWSLNPTYLGQLRSEGS